MNMNPLQTRKGKSEPSGMSGFSLLELVISMAVASIAALIIGTFFLSQNRMDAANARDFTQQTQGMYLLSTLTKEIRKAGYLHVSNGSDQDIDIADDNEIRFYVDDVSQVTFYYNATTDSVTQFTDIYTTGRTIYSDLNITNFSFSYFNNANTQLLTPVSSSSLEEIRKIDINYTVQADFTNLGRSADAITFNNSVRPRNLGMYEE